MEVLNLFSFSSVNIDLQTWLSFLVKTYFDKCSEKGIAKKV